MRIVGKILESLCLANDCDGMMYCIEADHVVAAKMFGYDENESENIWQTCAKQSRIRADITKSDGTYFSESEANALVKAFAKENVIDLEDHNLVFAFVVDSEELGRRIEKDEEMEREKEEEEAFSDFCTELEPIDLSDDFSEDDFEGDDSMENGFTEINLQEHGFTVSDFPDAFPEDDE